jgi:CHAD domain-containing protein
VLAALDGASHRALTTDLAELLTDPPLRGRARRPAAPAFEALLSQESRRLDRLVRAADDDPPDAVAALHEVRKGAKRLRYAAAATAPALGSRAQAISKQAKRIQSVLGDHRDAIEAAAALTTAAEDAHAAGADTTAYLALARSETAAAQNALAKYPAALAGLRAARAAAEHP